MKGSLIYAAAAFAVAVALSFILYVVVYTIMMITPQENDTRVRETVRAVCSYSRDITDGEAEEACGIAQDKSFTRWQCPSAEAATNTCTVEAR